MQKVWGNDSQSKIATSRPAKLSLVEFTSVSANKNEKTFAGKKID